MAHDMLHRREGGPETLEQEDLPQRPQPTQTLMSSILRTPRLKLTAIWLALLLEDTSKGVTRDINWLSWILTVFPAKALGEGEVEVIFVTQYFGREGFGPAHHGLLYVKFPIQLPYYYIIHG